MVTHHLDETHTPSMRSWVVSANASGCDFPVQNLPFGIFRRRASTEPFRGGCAIGDQILDLAAAVDCGLLAGQAREAAIAGSADSLNALMALGGPHRRALRLAMSRLLRAGATLTDQVSACLVPQSEAEFNLPARIGDFSDFYASIHHATNVGRLFRPDNPILPNFRWMPNAYHGRTSSIRVSGHSFHRPLGQMKPADSAVPFFGPCQRLDYEVELGILIGRGNEAGVPICIDDAEQHVFGLSILNDWSARDIQSWEYQPLGPFLAKSFATTLSPWVVTLEALEPFRVGWSRPSTEPALLPHLRSPALAARGAVDVKVEAFLSTERMRAQGDAPARLSLSHSRDSYWSIAQLVAHQTSNGCNLRPGDLLGTGTLSGPEPSAYGCLVELTKGGSAPVTLPNGETRRFLEDGDTVIMRAFCEVEGAARIGFGECVGTVAPALWPKAE